MNSNNMDIYNFSKDINVIITEYIIEHNSPIVYVSYDEEGDFQIFSNEGADMEKAMVISIANILELDSSLLLIAMHKDEACNSENINAKWEKI